MGLEIRNCVLVTEENCELLNIQKTGNIKDILQSVNKLYTLLVMMTE